MIKITVEIRFKHIGKIVFEDWLKCISEYMDFFDQEFTEISGLIGKGGNFTDKDAIELYKCFDEYEMRNEKILYLDKKALDNYQWLYKIK